jgi:N-formylglutamate amidohydrolase
MLASMIISRLSPYQVNVNRFREGSNDSSLPSYLRRDPFHGFSLTGKPVLLQEYSRGEEKLLWFYDRYHYLLEKAIVEMKEKYGYALVFDCHSMNSVALKHTPDEGKERPDFVIGTLDDTSAHPRIISAFYDALRSEAENVGLTVRKNYPYRGGFITRKYGNPSANVHVIQIEVKKSNYMNEGLSHDNDKEAFKIKPDGLKLINSIISKAIKVCCEEAAFLYER